MLSTVIAITNLIENLEGRIDNFHINAIKDARKRKIKRLLLVKNHFKQKTRVVPKVTNYFTTIKNYEGDVFRSHFQMLPSTFSKLQSSLKPLWTTAICGRLGYSLEKCLYVTLWKLCNSDVTFRELSDRFNVAKGTVHKIFYKIIELICLLKNEIMWPSASHQQTIMEDFKNNIQNSLPCVIGCVDRTHFNIPPPKHDATNYYNGKGNYTIIMQGICDSKFRFLDVFIGCPGSCHDAHVWKMSPISKSIATSQVEVAENAFILGGSSYPLSKFMMTPYRDNGHLSTEERQFNYNLSSTRAFVEQAYRILKEKFKILKYINLGSVEKASKVIYACTILHNFIINRENLTEYNIDDIHNANSFNNENVYPNSSISLEENEDDIDGVARRRDLTALLCS